MSRQFGLSRREASVGGGGGKPPGSLARSTPRDNIYSFPPLPRGSLLKPVEVSEPPVHKFQAFESALFVFTTAAALFLALFLLFFET